MPVLAALLLAGLSARCEGFSIEIARRAAGFEWWRGHLNPIPRNHLVQRNRRHRRRRQT